MDRYNLGLRIRKLCNDGIPVTELLTKKKWE